MRSASEPLSIDLAISGQPKGRRWHGIIVLVTALLLIALVAMAAYHGDVCFIITGQTELQRAVDARRLARAGSLVAGLDVAEAAARRFVRANPVRGWPLLDALRDSASSRPFGLYKS